jgi:glycine cleavage system T protein
MAPFAGYDMPITYEKGAVEEHNVTRRSVGLFDIDHMGQLEVSGPGADDFVSKMVSAKVLDMKDGDARYSLLLNEKGTVIDDLFIYKRPGLWWIVVNASNRATDVAWLDSHKPASVKIVDRSDDTYMIAVQGPKAIELLDLASSVKVSEFPRFTSGEGAVFGVKALIGRTGYTGEDGVELFFPADGALKVWEGFIALGAQKGIEVEPIGLAARDSLRFEAGMPLHGHEISPEINAIEAGFKWACDMEKDFLGKAALEKVIADGPSRKLVTLDVTGGLPREGYDVAKDGRKVGATVAGMFCPTTKKYAANAFVEAALAKVGTELEVLIRGQPKKCVVAKRPLYIPAYRR